MNRPLPRLHNLAILQLTLNVNDTPGFLPSNQIAYRSNCCLFVPVLLTEGLPGWNVVEIGDSQTLFTGTEADYLYSQHLSQYSVDDLLQDAWKPSEGLLNMLYFVAFRRMEGAA